MPCCVAVGCHTKELDKNAKPPITFHMFPSDPEEREKWIRAVRRANWTPSKSSRLCSKHFNANDFDRSPFCSKLKKGVVPSIFIDPEDFKPPKGTRTVKRLASPIKDTGCPSKVQLDAKLGKTTTLEESNAAASETKEVKEEDEDELEECDAMAHVEAVMEEETPEDREGPGQDGTRRELQDCSSVYPVTQLIRGQLDSIDTFFLGLAGTVKKLKPVNQIKLKKAIAILVFDAELQETSNRASTFS